jgi:tetratricopeptide (TPR) repeat protein
MERPTYSLSWFLAAWLLVAGLMSSAALASGINPAISSLEIQANQFYDQRANLDQAQKAIEQYLKILEMDPGHTLAAIRLAKLYVWVGYHQGESLELYEKAMEVAEAAVKRHPKKPGPRYWLGVAYGLKATAPKTGPITCLALIDPIEQQMKTLIELDPTYEYGGPWRVLGRINTKMPFLLGGDKDLAEEYLRKALKMGPKYYLNHLYLADVLGRLDRREEAYALLRQVVKGEAMPGLEPETKLWKRTALEILSQSAKLTSN